MRKMRKRLRLNDKHPFMKKLEKLFTLMADEGIKIRVCRDGSLIAVDMADDYKEYEMSDADDGSNVGHIPPIFDYKLVYEKVVDDE